MQILPMCTADAVISINSSVGKKNYFQANQISACYQQELCILKIGGNTM